MTTTLLRFKLALILAAIVLFANNLSAATLFENFDSPSVLYNNENSSGGIATYNSGNWYCLLNKMSDTDHYNGAGGIRLRGLAGKNMLEMKFDKQGAGVVSFLYGSYSGHNGGIIILQKSTDQGANWTDIGTAVTLPVWNGTFFNYSQRVDVQENVRFRIFTTVTSNSNQKINIDDFMITDYGTEQVSIPVSSSLTGIYETPQTVTLISATAGATIYYTIDGTAPTTASSVYSSPLNITTTTKIRAYAVANGKIDSREQIVIVNFPIEVNNIAALYNSLPTLGTNPQYYKYTGEAIISFVYWASNTSTAKKIVLQDNTAGIIIDDFYKLLAGSYTIGDKVTGFIAQVNNTNDAPMLYPYADFTVLSSNNTIDAKVITMANVASNTYQLVQLNDLYFDAADGAIKFGVYSFRVIHDASTPITDSIVYNTPNVIAVNPNYIGTVIPAKTNLIGLIMRNNPTNSGINSNTPYYYIFPRMLTDLDVPFKPTTGVSQIKTYNLSISANKVQFETLIPESIKVYSTNGQLIKSIISEVGKNSIALDKGIYIIKIGGAKGSKVVL